MKNCLKPGFLTLWYLMQTLIFFFYNGQLVLVKVAHAWVGPSNSLI